MTRAITAIFSSRAAAERARDGVLALGVPQDAVLVRGGDDQEDTEHGFWRELFASFIPQSEHPTYLEGIRQGSFVLAVQVPDEQAGAVQRVLDGQGACVAGGAGSALGVTAGPARPRSRSYGQVRSS